MQPTPTQDHRSRRGAALLELVPAVLVVMALMMAFVRTAVDTGRTVDRRTDVFDARAAAQSVVSLAAEDVWTGFEAWTVGRKATVADFRAYMDARGIPDRSDEAGPVGVDMLPVLQLPRGEDDVPVLDGVEIERMEAYRIDDFDSSSVVFSTTLNADRGNDRATGHDSRRTYQHVFAVEPPAWDGLDYALLANDVSCVMCHTTIDNAQRVYNDDATELGTFARVRAGTLEDFHFRSAPDSSVVGTMYIGGQALLGDGTPVSDWSSMSLKSALFDHEGRVWEDEFGSTKATDLSPEDPLTAVAGGNLYLAYSAGVQPDGELPARFPSPFPDNGGVDPSSGSPVEENANNRVVDHSEFHAVTGDSRGSISGGRTSVLPHGRKMQDAQRPEQAPPGTPPRPHVVGHVRQRLPRGSAERPDPHRR